MSKASNKETQMLELSRATLAQLLEQSLDGEEIAVQVELEVTITVLDEEVVVDTDLTTSVVGRKA